MLDLARMTKDELCDKQVKNTNVKVCVNISNQCWRCHSGVFWVLDVLTAGVRGPWRIINLSELRASVHSHVLVLTNATYTHTISFNEVGKHHLYAIKQRKPEV